MDDLSDQFSQATPARHVFSGKLDAVRKIQDRVYGSSFHRGRFPCRYFTDNKYLSKMSGHTWKFLQTKIQTAIITLVEILVCFPIFMKMSLLNWFATAATSPIIFCECFSLPDRVQVDLKNEWRALPLKK